MSLADRILPLCDLLLGAAHADKHFADRERHEVREMLADLSGDALTPELEERIASFDPATYDLARTAGAFAVDTEDDRRRLLFLVAAIHDADEEIDLAEDDYLRALANALFLPSSALDGLTVDIEIEEMREDFARVRKGPPAPPRAAGSVDVDLD